MLLLSVPRASLFFWLLPADLGCSRLLPVEEKDDKYQSFAPKRIFDLGCSPMPRSR